MTPSTISDAALTTKLTAWTNRAPNPAQDAYSIGIYCGRHISRNQQPYWKETDMLKKAETFGEYDASGKQFFAAAKIIFGKNQVAFQEGFCRAYYQGLQGREDKRHPIDFIGEKEAITRKDMGGNFKLSALYLASYTSTREKLRGCEPFSLIDSMLTAEESFSTSLNDQAKSKKIGRARKALQALSQKQTERKSMLPVEPSQQVTAPAPVGFVARAHAALSARFRGAH